MAKFKEAPKGVKHLDREKIKEWKDSNIHDFAAKYFSYIKSIPARVEKACEELRKYHYKVNREGVIFEERERKPDFDFVVKDGKKIGIKFKGKSSLRAWRNGFNVTLFPGRADSEELKGKLFASIMSWGGFGLRLPLDASRIFTRESANSIRIHIGDIILYPKDEGTAKQVEEYVTSHSHVSPHEAKFKKVKKAP